VHPCLPFFQSTFFHVLSCSACEDIPLLYVHVCMYVCMPINLLRFLSPFLNPKLFINAAHSGISYC
jgi:hypothetical protein